eukprot:jgi/Bigna1/79370/fgenesh1_pg.62_\
MCNAHKKVLKVLSSIHASDGSDVVYKGLVTGVRATDEGLVSLSLELTKEYRHLKKRIQAEVEQIDWVSSCRVSMAAPPPSSSSSSSSSPSPSSRPAGKGNSSSSSVGGGLKDVKHIIAVSSCKGGVGKSTVSVNLAYALSEMGFKVGILDADVYGPSLPTMLTPSDPTLRLNNTNGLIVAPVYMDVKLMSFGFSNPFDPLSTEKKARQSTIMRGPMASGVIQRLATDTDWGDLDYLVVDFPPGEGVRKGGGREEGMP